MQIDINVYEGDEYMSKANNEIFKLSFNVEYENLIVGGYGGFGFSSFDAPMHRHNDYYEITCVTSGVYMHTHNEQIYTLTPGTLILMAPHSVHQLYTEPMQATFYAICIHEDFFNTYFKQHFPEYADYVFPPCSTIQLDSDDFAYLQRLGHQMSVPRPPLYVADMITHLTLINILFKKDEPRVNRTDNVERVLSILNEPANLHIATNKLYQAVDISVSALIKSFKEQTGYTIVGYKNKKRLELAANMLKTSNKKVIDIAYELHFESLSYFLRAFKKEFGITPTEYRKTYKKIE